MSWPTDRLRLFAGVLAVLGLSAEASAQATSLPVTLSGEVRVRTELDGRSAGVPHDFATLLRTRLGVTAIPHAEMRAVIRLSDSRVFGEESNTLTDASADRLDLHEGFIEWSPAGSPGLRVRAGRQELAYGDERLIGTVGWANVTRSFDGIQVKVPAGKWSIDGFAATLREFDATSATGVNPRANEGSAADQSLFGAWATNGKHDLFAIAETRVAGSGLHDVFRRTVGTHLQAPLAGLIGDVTGAYQFGSARVGTGDRHDIAAWLVTGSLAKQWTSPTKPRLGLTLDLLSGDSDPTDATDHTFNTLYATNHKFYGLMDLVLDPASQLNGRGLMDAALKSSVQQAGWRVALDLHRFRLLETQSSSDPQSLGTELDLTASRTLAPGLGLLTGASWFRPGAAATNPGIGLGDRSLWWSYVQVTATF